MKKLILKSLGKLLNVMAVVAPKRGANSAFNLLIKVNRAPISESGMTFLKKGTQTYLEMGKHSAVLHKWGSGPKNILFLHGWMSNSQRWLPYYERLDMSEYTLYALDAPGHGMAKSNNLNIEIFRQAIVQSLEKIGEVDTVICHSLSNTAMTYLNLVNPNLPIKKYVTMGAPTGMDAIFVYFKDMLNLSDRAINNLGKKVNSIFKIPHDQVHIKNFFKSVLKPILVVHDKYDIITPIAPIQKALKGNPEIETYFTEGLAHDLKGESVYDRVIQFISETEHITKFTKKEKEHAQEFMSL